MLLNFLDFLESYNSISTYDGTRTTGKSDFIFLTCVVRDGAVTAFFLTYKMAHALEFKKSVGPNFLSLFFSNDFGRYCL